MARRFLYSLYGFVVGLGVPCGWLLWRAFSTRRQWWISWLQTEMDRHSGVYIGLAMCAVAFFSVIGYLIGKRKSDFLQETETIKDANIELEQLASTDGLTKLFNARTINERLDIEIENSRRSPLTCLLIDLDYFKRINDQFGHPFGDVVLVNIAKTMKKAVRRVDIVGRLGGEEFIVVLPDTSLDRAVEIAERIREAIQTEVFQFEQKTIHVTASIGVVMYPSEGLRDTRSLLKAADEALYAAKKSGRNRVVLWEQPRGVA